MAAAQANLKLLGDTIKGFREGAQPKKVSQFRLATMMQWEGTAPVIEIEKGRRRPRPETLNALGEVLQLSPADIAYLHGLAGYRDVTVMPPAEQIVRVLQSIEPDIAQRIYPVYVMDYQFRFWMINSAIASSQGEVDDVVRAMMTQRIDGLSMSFDSRLPFHHGSTPSTDAEREAVFRFKAYNLYRRHEPFYLAHPECVENRLLPEDYQRFVTRWHEVDVRMQDVYPITPQLTENMGDIELHFDIHMVEIPHLDRLLFIAYYEPKDDGVGGNRERCEAYFSRHVPGERMCICAWDYL